MFGCLTVRVGVSLVTIVYIVIGFGAWALAGLEFERSLNVIAAQHHHDPCQFRGCNHHPLEMVSCANLNSATWDSLWFILMAGFFAGMYGYTGMVERKEFELSIFYYFIMAQFIITVGIFVSDNAYLELCGRYPELYWRILQMAVPHRLALVELMGLDPNTLPPSVLDDLIGITSIWYLRVFTLVPIAFLFYILLKVGEQIEKCGQGPIGMGSMYGIDFATEEWSTVTEIGTGIQGAIKDVIKPNPVRHFPIHNLLLGSNESPTSFVNTASVGYKPQNGWCTRNMKNNPHHEKMYGTFPESA